MKIRYFSDLHVEFLRPHEMDAFLQQIPTPESNEICVLAGDIGHPRDPLYDTFMQYISRHFTKTFVIPGNHEYYHATSTMEETDLFLHNYFESFENISFLNNTYEIYENTCFIGSVLWTHISNPQYTINDLKMIPNLTVDKYNQLHQTCVDFLKDTIPKHENCVVITHHIPSFSLVNPKFKDPLLLPYNQWFSCDMESLFSPHIKAWFYGHTHLPFFKKIEGIPFLCNPIGYPYENDHHDFSAHIIL